MEKLFSSVSRVSRVAMQESVTATYGYVVPFFVLGAIQGNLEKNKPSVFVEIFEHTVCFEAVQGTLIKSIHQNIETLCWHKRLPFLLLRFKEPL